MQLEECLYSRRSVRAFQDVPLPQEVLHSIVHAGMTAPSACNQQALKVIAVTKNVWKQLLYNPILQNAPVSLLVTYRNDLEGRTPRYNDVAQSAAAAIQNMLLYAHSVGVGGCWVCHLPSQDALRQVFRIPENFDPIACVALGYPRKGEENTQEQIDFHYASREDYEAHTRRYTLEQVLCEERFAAVPGDCAELPAGAPAPVPGEVRCE